MSVCWPYDFGDQISLALKIKSSRNDQTAHNTLLAFQKKVFKQRSSQDHQHSPLKAIEQLQDEYWSEPEESSDEDDWKSDSDHQESDPGFGEADAEHFPHFSDEEGEDEMQGQVMDDEEPMDEGYGKHLQVCQKWAQIFEEVYTKDNRGKTDNEREKMVAEGIKEMRDARKSLYNTSEWQKAVQISRLADVIRKISKPTALLDSQNPGANIIDRYYRLNLSLSEILDKWSPEMEHEAWDNTFKPFVPIKVHGKEITGAEGLLEVLDQNMDIMPHKSYAQASEWLGPALEHQGYWMTEEVCRDLHQKVMSHIGMVEKQVVQDLQKNQKARNQMMKEEKEMLQKESKTADDIREIEARAAAITEKEEALKWPKINDKLEIKSPIFQLIIYHYRRYKVHRTRIGEDFTKSKVSVKLADLVNLGCNKCRADSNRKRCVVYHQQLNLKGCAFPPAPAEEHVEVIRISKSRRSKKGHKNAPKIIHPDEYKLAGIDRDPDVMQNCGRHMFLIVNRDKPQELHNFVYYGAADKVSLRVMQKHSNGLTCNPIERGVQFDFYGGGNMFQVGSGQGQGGRLGHVYISFNGTDANTLQGMDMLFDIAKDTIFHTEIMRMISSYTINAVKAGTASTDRLGTVDLNMYYCHGYLKSICSQLRWIGKRKYHEYAFVDPEWGYYIVIRSNTFWSFDSGFLHGTMMPAKTPLSEQDWLDIEAEEILVDDTDLPTEERALRLCGGLGDHPTKHERDVMQAEALDCIRNTQDERNEYWARHGDD
ncbi:hypothetical protein C8J56DRAFT_973215 [Mycena floridula]|nr:hypothetical protein C8J56DRAFT_973215 [Mycena floridula]